MSDIHMSAGLLDYWAKSDTDRVPHGPFDRDLDPFLPALGQHLNGLLDSDGSPFSTVALLDWSTVRHVHALLTSKDIHLDPFVALADLNALLAAALFYDRAVVVDDYGYTAEVAEMLGISDVLLPLPSRFGPETPWGTPVLLEYFDSSFQMSAADLFNEDADSAFTLELNHAWKDLIPSVSLPAERDVNEVGWSLSPGKLNLFQQLFQSGQMWVPAERFIIENDVRAMTYENAASVLTAALATGDLTGPNVRYLGGVFRAPMQSAIRARWRHAWDRMGGLPIETSLNEWWAQKAGKSGVSPAFPFWLSAVLYGCETRSDLAIEVPKWRRRSKDLRRRRSEVERLILDGDHESIELYKRAIGGAVESLADAKAAAAVPATAAAATKAALAVTGIAPFMTDAAAAVLDSDVVKQLSPRTTWLMRITRPRLWFLAKANVSASHLAQPMYRLKDLFQLPNTPHDALGFLSKANSLEWTA